MLLLNLLSLFAIVGCISASDSSNTQGRLQHYAITGAHTGVKSTGQRPSRRNILDLQNDIPAWSLYIQALAALQATPETEPLSYFQLAGIHGRPYIPWDGVSQSPGSPLTGYCAHSSILFPTWHRPYLALFEQALALQAQKIAKAYPVNLIQTYQAAADALRIPYWDWAATSQIPNAVTSPTVTINSPSGTRTITNPLWQYKFQKFPLDNVLFPTDQSISYDWYLGMSDHTVRAPDAIGAPSNISQANQALAGSQLQSYAYNALTKATNFDDFASTVRGGPSIEAGHDNVHMDVGGSWGHMSQLSYAAFDPIFWLHHCNVDRLLALYQAINPNSYLTPYPEYYGSYTLVPGTSNTLYTPLEPFSINSNGDFYTSSTCQSLGMFGYTYPEIQDWNQSPQQLRVNVIAKINSLYRPSSRTSRRDSSAQSSVTEWSVAISVSKFAFSGRRFVIRLFLDTVPENQEEWADSCIGSFAILPPPTRISGQMPDTKAHNEISLVEALDARGYDGQNIGATSRYLTDHLQWRVQMLDGGIASPDQFHSLTVMVQEELVTMGRDDTELPEYGDKILHPEITRGKIGGYVG